ncbi:MAG: HIRAN domain-containing protein [Actinomycetota bacterium]|nr:HIRAN domain-containing protein [Actinomycetota bacterium]
MSETLRRRLRRSSLRTLTDLGATVGFLDRIGEAMRSSHGTSSAGAEPDAHRAPASGDDRWYVESDGDADRFVGTPPPLHLIDYRDSGGERVLRLCEDSTGLLVGPTDRRLQRAGIFVSQLRGEAYHEQDCRRGDFAPGSPVKLVREPSNPHDPNAVAIYDSSGRHHAAYVNKQKARSLARLLDAGQELAAISIRGTKAGVACSQVAILAADPGVLRHLLSPRPTHLPPPAHVR